MSSIGDGLVTQIPALLVSTASGVIVTRAASQSNMGTDLAQQFTREPRAILVAGAALLLFGLVPGMPTMTFVMIGLLVGGVGFLAKDSHRKQAVIEQRASEQAEREPSAPEERTEDLLKVDTIGLEIGYGLIPLVARAHRVDDINSVRPCPPPTTNHNGKNHDC